MHNPLHTAGQHRDETPSFIDVQPFIVPSESTIDDHNLARNAIRSRSKDSRALGDFSCEVVIVGQSLFEVEY